MILRPYQQQAHDSIYQYFGINDGNPLVILPTGTGKSLVIAAFAKSAVSTWPDTRIIVATHVKELVGQNQAEFHALCPEIPSGVYSAGLGKRQLHRPVVFCGIQSVFRKAYTIQRCDILIVDEAHTIPKKGEGMWRQFIKELKEINPHLKIIGLTATGFRLDSGNLTSGEDRIFTDVCYEYPVLKALEEKYLTPVVPKYMATGFDVSNVKKRGNEFIAGELERAIDIDEKTKSAVQEIIEYGLNRKGWLIFAAGNKHAAHVNEYLVSNGIKSKVLTQETGNAERDQIISDFKAQTLTCIVNNMILTTGFNAPHVDLIACLRPTQSAGLWVQMCGRGMRNFPGKENCLLLDFARNTDRHGPIDQIRGRDRNSSGDGAPPVKVCEKCHCVCFAGCRNCPDCGYEFPAGELEITKTASNAPVFSTQIEPEWHNVNNMKLDRHEKPGKIPSMRVSYYTLSGIFREWICFEHTGYAKEKAAKWHRQRTSEPMPRTVNDAIERGYAKPERICVRQNGKFFDIIAYDWLRESFEPPREEIHEEVIW